MGCFCSVFLKIYSYCYNFVKCVLCEKIFKFNYVIVLQIKKFLGGVMKVGFVLFKGIEMY